MKRKVYPNFAGNKFTRTNLPKGIIGIVCKKLIEACEISKEQIPKDNALILLKEKAEEIIDIVEINLDCQSE